MSYPTDPPGPASSNAATLVGLAVPRLTPEDAEQLAATFRPSWELDDAPFVAPGMLAEGDLRALPSSGTQADVRGAVHALNGTHAPAPATVLHEEPANSVILDRSIAAENSPPAGGSPHVFSPGPVSPARVSPAGAPTAVAAPPTPDLRTLPATPGSRTPYPAGPHSFPASAATRPAPAPSSDAGDVRVAKRSKLGLWLGLSAAGIGLAVGAWLASTSGEKRDAASPAVETAQTVEPSRIPPPPPPAEAPVPPPTVQAAPVPAAAQAPAIATATVPPTPPPPPAVTAAPVPPTPRLVVPPAPRPPTWNPGAAPAPRPAPRPKAGGPTIVRDVPF